MKYFRLTLLILSITFFNIQDVYSQIISPNGVSTRASSQMIYWYDIALDGQTIIQVTNTNDTEGVWIHVQIFRSFDPDGNPGNGDGDEVICEERDFVDFLTPNDTHIYDLSDNPFNKNIGEDDATLGDDVNIDLTDTAGFLTITPVESESNLSAISFQHLIGQQVCIQPLVFNAIGRDAVDFATGEIVPDGTPLDGVTNGYVVIQPEELLFDFNLLGNGSTIVEIAGIAFEDSYGPPGLLGYQVLPSSADWTPFIFDFNEDPTSCGNKNIACYDTVGLNDTFVQGNLVLGPELLCAGTITPPNAAPDTFGWTRIFVSNLGDFTNHFGVFAMLGFPSGADWMYAKGEESDINPAENCAVAGDEDGDMAADCADPDCVGLAGPSGETCEAAEATCDDGFDNDGDGATDGADTDCDGSESCPSCESGDQCSDGEDNDGDGNSDCADGGCDGATGPNGETCEAGVELTCNDNQDNDGDGTADCDDPDCAIATNCIAGEGGGGGGCSVASTASPSMLNFLLPIIAVGLVIGFRRKRCN